MNVHVECVDEDTGEVVARSALPLSELPDDFREPADGWSMRIGDVEWTVVRAEPGLAQEFARSGTLRLTLRRVLSLQSQDLLFSQPTLPETLPSLARGTRRSGDVLELSEDDWRQVELVSLSCHEAVHTCLGGVRAVLADQRASLGWRQLYVRRGLRTPLPPDGFDLAWLRERFPELSAYDGLSYRGLTPLIEGGFAYRAPSGIDVYGQLESGSVRVLALRGWGDGEALAQDVDALIEVARTHRLCLLDWCRGKQLLPTDFRTYFQQRSSAG